MNPTRRKLLSPRDLATAIGASESSLKRWTDQGLLTVTRTAGGHRRIPVTEAIRFVRERRMTLVKPEVLGLPANLGPANTMASDKDTAPDETFYDLLRSGHDIGARNHLIARFIAGESIASIADGPLRSAMQALGETWHQNPQGILMEHRATEICVEVLQELRNMVMPAKPLGRAIGGAIGGDPYKLPPLVATSVLNECGLQVVNLGADTPVDVLELACFGDAVDIQPDIAWLSVSVIESAERTRESLVRFATRCRAADIAVCIGGRASTELDLPADIGIDIHTTMVEFAEFAKAQFPPDPH